MKKCLTTLMFVSVIAVAQGQSVTPEVTASAGTHFSASNIQVSWTIGEPLTATLSNSNNKITQGFHQALLMATSIEEQSLNGVNIDVYPNPAIDILNINVQNYLGELQLELFDMEGKLLQNQQVYASQENIQVNMGGYARAHYLLRIYSKDGNINYTYKIVKLNTY